LFGTSFFQILLWFLALHAGVQGVNRPGQQRATRNPHGPLNIPCENCHTFTSWKPIRSVPEFSHDKTRYPLRGLHEKVECRQCHTKLVFTNVGTTCADCHADIHRRQMGANCEQCHTVKGWQVSVQAIRNHQNRFPLIGAHASLDCAACHKGAAVGQFRGLATQCLSCHAGTYQKTTSPNHMTAGFPTTCEQCHTMNTWLDAKFDHSTTGFPLTGAHAQLLCTSCHIGGRFQGTPANCVGCHLPDFQRATNPNHVQVGLPQTCQTCHTTTAWTPASFNHNTFTRFPLTGAHVSVPCASCHVNGRFAGTPTDCASCHLKDYQATTNPNHAAAGFPTDCSVCHTTASWAGATFDHSRTGFPLTGAHVNLACAACHVNGNYNLTTAACSSCHLKDYQNTTNPNHVAAGLPQQCQVCHTTTAWQPASFDHSKTIFPLTGAHVNVPCASCHVNNNYTTVPTDCYSCHKTDYNNTTNPNHAAAGFPTTCQTCHTTTAWTGATFNHTWFPRNHGGATTCGDCHTNPSNYMIFTCLSCHAHDKARMDQKHQGVRGYVYNSSNCYSCHPTGRGG
jgi:hypothetical protein